MVPQQTTAASDNDGLPCSATGKSWRPGHCCEASASRALFVFHNSPSIHVVVLKINHKLFSNAINEYYDFAANMLQIEDAKHFHDLLGNYSRWGFHHPGPAYFYILALGETILHDWLRIAPEAMNAHLITIILLNSIFLFAAISIFAQHCQSRLFVPVALALAIYVIYMVNHTIPGSAVLSIWMPHVLLFCFLLFATVCASVAAGNVKQLPILAFTGLMLLHAHVAQLYLSVRWLPWHS